MYIFISLAIYPFSYVQNTPFLSLFYSQYEILVVNAQYNFSVCDKDKTGSFGII